YTVKLIVKDDDNDIGVMSVWLTIKNKLPTALFTFKPEKPRQDEVVTFNASASKDADGEIKNYSWDFESDGIIDAYGEEVKHAFGEKKPYTVTLTVVDDDGAQDTFTFVVNVREKEKTPGFELMILLAASAILIFMKRRRIGIWRM
ncbi:MAG TPA: PKD domain-containing protein, partial [Thermoplasmatales archaeon]|nr:PKD domain-containing protein [Thermoplasmatales archaeon]